MTPGMLSPGGFPEKSCTMTTMRYSIGEIRPAPTRALLQWKEFGERGSKPMEAPSPMEGPRARGAFFFVAPPLDRSPLPPAWAPNGGEVRATSATRAARSDSAALAASDRSEESESAMTERWRQLLDQLGQELLGFGVLAVRWALSKLFPRAPVVPSKKVGLG